MKNQNVNTDPFPKDPAEAADDARGGTKVSESPKREVRILRQISGTQDHACELGFKFAMDQGGFSALERVVHLKLAHGSGWGVLADKVFDALCGQDSGGPQFQSTDEFWENIFEVDAADWFPTSIHIIGFVEGIYEYWAPTREELEFCDDHPLDMYL